MNKDEKTAPFKAAAVLLLCLAFLLCGCGTEKLFGSAESSVESAEVAYKSGFGLYVDGCFVAACADAEDISASVDTVSGLLALSYGMSEKGAELTNDVRIIKNSFEESCFVDADGLLRLLGVNDGGISFGFTDYSGNALDINPTVVSKTMIKREDVLAAEVVVRETDLLAVGESLTVTEAADGAVVNTYSITMQNGVATESVLVGSTVKEAAVSGEQWIGSGNGATLMSADKKLMLPYDGKVSSWFGWRILWDEPDFHQGLDFVALDGGCYGDPIYAAEDGVVSFSGSKTGYGNLVVVSHSQSMDTLYAHCSKLLVEEGDVVKRGDVVALVGDTGRVTAAHLHFGIQIDGDNVDPKGYLDWSHYKG